MAVYNYKVASVTYAIKGRNLLRQRGYKAYIDRTDDPQAGEGCGYRIILHTTPYHIDGADALLAKAGVKILGRYEGVAQDDLFR